MDTEADTDTGTRPAFSAAQHRVHEFPGRPHRVFPRLSTAEKELIDAAAAASGLTAAGFMAKAALAAAEPDATGPSAPATGDLRELQRELFAARRAVTMFGVNVNQAATAYNSTGRLPDWVADAVRLCAGAVERLDAVTARIDRRLR